MPLLLAVIALLLAPGAAAAATLTTTFDPGGPGKGQTPLYAVAYVAGAGEANAVSVRVDGAALVVEDTGAPLTASGLCTAVDAHAARCPALHGGMMPYVTVTLGDGADAGAMNGLMARIDGGDGPDALSGPLLDGGAGDDVLTGTEGSDLLAPGPGADEVRAAGGDDLVEAADAGAAGSDRLDGGAGADTVRYAETGLRAAGVVVDLGASVAMGAGQGTDGLTGFEHATGGEGRDTLIGDAGANRLSGAGGRDALRGGAGADRLAGEHGRDAVDGGDGDDLLIARADGVDSSSDTFACGAGRDAIKFAYLRDVVGADCEALDNTRFPEDALGPRFDPHPRAARGHRLVFRVPCEARRCRIAVALAVEGRTIARARRAGAGRVRVVVRLDRRARRALRAAHGRAQVTVALGDGFGYAYTATLGYQRTARR